MACRGLACTSNVLIDAHIIPRGFSRDVLRGEKHLLGYYDDYAIDICRKFGAEHTAEDGVFSMKHVDGDRFAKFALAVLGAPQSVLVRSAKKSPSGCTKTLRATFFSRLLHQ
jgi:hypothetical protein